MVDATEPEHPFLKYASKYMILHTKEFQEGRSVMWVRWKEMMIYGSDLIETPYGVKSLKEDDLSILNWSISAHHHALLRLIYLGLGSSSGQDRGFVLWRAAYDGQLDAVKVLLDAGADVHYSRGIETVLRVSLMRGFFDVADQLILAGADVNMPDRNGQTALHQAADCGYLNIVEKLLDLGANINLPGRDRQTALHQTADCQHMDIVDKLLGAGADVNIQGFHDQTVLFQAVHYGRYHVFKRLLDTGADVNIQATHGETAIHAAFRRKDLHIVEMLLDAGADVNIRGQDGETALHFASECARGNLDILERVLVAVADVDVPTFDGETALYRAARYGNLDAMDRLLSAGADANAISTWDEYDGPISGARKWSVLHMATLRGNMAVVDKLLEVGVDVNAVLEPSSLPYESRPTALQIAITCGHQDIAEKIKRVGGH
ncbi:uncharacterized protein TRUGW13939_10122 [Talaromyces rugulosus]|uniref:Uncharacterized protein n=1 Tax=Talaromyces rugulosus TaxID=121627 RepID=A0A7H8R952_TALRU|nr:uncharacterized protein TRUGW13939_10122 [Talaromyces rugulosus]QKX62954.1 hypothetical protein TRUGW13939_10122 [Talaromyces rugulosus]